MTRRALTAWSALLLAAILVAAIGLLLLETPASPVRIETESLSNSASGGARLESANVVSAVPRSEFGTSTEAERRNSSAFLRGRVLDATFGSPLSALVEPDRGPPILTDPQSGQFELRSEHFGTEALVAFAHGYEAARIVVADLPEPLHAELRLAPREWGTVRVVRPSGAPVQGVAVVWRAATESPWSGYLAEWVDGVATAPGEGVRTLTDEFGLSRLALVDPCLASVEAPDLDHPLVVRVAPREEVEVVLREAFVLRAVEIGSMDSIEGLDLELWSPLADTGSSVRVRTDRSGEARVGWLEPPILIRRPRGAVFESELLPLSPDLTRTNLGGGLKTMLRLQNIPDSRVVVFGVADCGGSLALVDATTGAPVEGPVRVSAGGSAAPDGHREVSSETQLSPRASFGRGYSIQYAPGGRLVLPCSLFPGQEQDPARTAPLEIRILAAGYASRTVEARRVPPKGSDQALEVPLEPALQRSLRVLHADGRPYRLELELYSPRDDVLVWFSSGEPDGVHGPWDWSGGPLEARNLSFAIAEGALRDEAVVTVRLEDPTGTLVVQEIPSPEDALDLVAKHGAGPDSVVGHPTGIDAEGARFEGLSPGAYLVGPRAWVQAMELESMRSSLGSGIQARASRVVVAPGRITRVRWDGRWSGAPGLDGTVRLESAPRVRPWLVPKYAVRESTAENEATGPPARIHLSRMSPRITIDERGRYEIPAGDPLPELLVVCVPSEGPWGHLPALHALDVIRPGGSSLIEVGTVELRWSGAPPAYSVPVSFRVPPAALSVPEVVWSEHRIHWEVSAPLRLGVVPTSVESLTVSGFSVPVVVQRGSTTVVELDHASLLASPKAPR